MVPLKSDMTFDNSYYFPQSTPRNDHTADTSPRIKAERLAAVQAAFKEKQKRSDEWIKSQPKTDYVAICDAIRAGAATKH